MLLDTLERCYFAFRRRLISIRQATTCQCNACVLIPNLDLKFCACVEAMKIDPSSLGMREHREGYDNFGEVLAYIHDLQPRWKQEQELRRDLVAPEEADMKLEFTFPAPPPLVWEYMTSPVKRPVWAEGSDRVRSAEPTRPPRRGDYQPLRARQGLTLGRRSSTGGRLTRSRG